MSATSFSEKAGWTEQQKKSWRQHGKFSDILKKFNLDPEKEIWGLASIRPAEGSDLVVEVECSGTDRSATWEYSIRILPSADDQVRYGKGVTNCLWSLKGTGDSWEMAILSLVFILDEVFFEFHSRVKFQDPADESFFSWLRENFVTHESGLKKNRGMTQKEFLNEKSQRLPSSVIQQDIEFRRVVAGILATSGARLGSWLNIEMGSGNCGEREYVLFTREALVTIQRILQRESIGDLACEEKRNVINAWKVYQTESLRRTPLSQARGWRPDAVQVAAPEKPVGLPGWNEAFREIITAKRKPFFSWIRAECAREDWRFNVRVLLTLSEMRLHRECDPEMADDLRKEVMKAWNVFKMECRAERRSKKRKKEWDRLAVDLENELVEKVIQRIRGMGPVDFDKWLSNRQKELAGLRTDELKNAHHRETDLIIFVRRNIEDHNELWDVADRALLLTICLPDENGAFRRLTRDDLEKAQQLSSDLDYVVSAQLPPELRETIRENVKSRHLSASCFLADTEEKRELVDKILESCGQPSAVVGPEIDASFQRIEDGKVVEMMCETEEEYQARVDAATDRMMGLPKDLGVSELASKIDELDIFDGLRTSDILEIAWAYCITNTFKRVNQEIGAAVADRLSSREPVYTPQAAGPHESADPEPETIIEWKMENLSGESPKINPEACAAPPPTSDPGTSIPLSEVVKTLPESLRFTVKPELNPMVSLVKLPGARGFVARITTDATSFKYLVPVFGEDEVAAARNLAMTCWAFLKCYNYLPGIFGVDGLFLEEICYLKSIASFTDSSETIPRESPVKVRQNPNGIDLIMASPPCRHDPIPAQGASSRRGGWIPFSRRSEVCRITQIPSDRFWFKGEVLVEVYQNPLPGPKYCARLFLAPQLLESTSDYSELAINELVTNLGLEMLTIRDKMKVGNAPRALSGSGTFNGDEDVIYADLASKHLADYPHHLGFKQRLDYVKVDPGMRKIFEREVIDRKISRASAVYRLLDPHDSELRLNVDDDLNVLLWDHCETDGSGSFTAQFEQFQFLWKGWGRTALDAIADLISRSFHAFRAYKEDKDHLRMPGDERFFSRHISLQKCDHQGVMNLSFDARKILDLRLPGWDVFPEIEKPASVYEVPMEESHGQAVTFSTLEESWKLHSRIFLGFFKCGYLALEDLFLEIHEQPSTVDHGTIYRARICDLPEDLQVTGYCVGGDSSGCVVEMLKASVEQIFQKAYRSDGTFKPDATRELKKFLAGHAHRNINGDHPTEGTYCENRNEHFTQVTIKSAREAVRRDMSRVEVSLLEHGRIKGRWDSSDSDAEVMAINNGVLTLDEARSQMEPSWQEKLLTEISILNYNWGIDGNNLLAVRESLEKLHFIPGAIQGIQDVTKDIRGLLRSAEERELRDRLWRRWLWNPAKVVYLVAFIWMFYLVARIYLEFFIGFWEFWPNLSE